MMNHLLFNIAFSFLSSVAFGAICDVPRKSLVTGGIVGVIGWLGFWVLNSHGAGIFIASFVCSLLLATVGQFAARWHKMPLTVFYIPGLAPVVPGITSYQAFRDLLVHDYREATFGLMNVGFSAIGITCGLVVSDIITRIVFSLRVVKHKPSSE